jgi:hypothetical protein
VDLGALERFGQQQIRQHNGGAGGP